MYGSYAVKQYHHSYYIVYLHFLAFPCSDACLADTHWDILAMLLS